MFKKLIDWFWGTSDYTITSKQNPNITEGLVASASVDTGPQGKPVELSPKEKATLAGEPYISVLSVEIDPKDINNGSFELDWNDKFIINLTKAGYKIGPDDTDAEIVDRWFTQVCRNIVMEIYEQQMADPEKRMEEELKANDIRIVTRKNLGDGRIEVS